MTLLSHPTTVASFTAGDEHQHRETTGEGHDDLWKVLQLVAGEVTVVEDHSHNIVACSYTIFSQAAFRTASKLVSDKPLSWVSVHGLVAPHSYSSVSWMAIILTRTTSRANLAHRRKVCEYMFVKVREWTSLARGCGGAADLLPSAWPSTSWASPADLVPDFYQRRHHTSLPFPDQFFFSITNVNLSLFIRE